MSPALPSNWKSVLVTAALDEDRPIIRPTVKTAARDYREAGAFPIVDQSQNAIAGWTDNAAAVLRPARPVVVFGDHTRAFKYVDFPFATGADGTLVLNPSLEFEPRFFYFACLGLDIAARGYNRHYTMLKEMNVPKPPIDEQRKIAAILAKVQAAVAVEGDLVRVARELKQAALRQLFTRGLRHEPQKQTTLGLVPESWDVVPVAECVTPFRFDRKQQVPAAAYSETGRFPIVDQGKQAIAGYCDDETKVITPRPALIVFGDHTRCVKFVDFPFVLGSDGTKPLVAKPEWDARTLFYALSSVDVESHGYNRHYKYLSEKLVARSPDPAEQREIAGLLATLDAKIAHHEARQALLRELFRTLLHDLLTARRRVTFLDPAALPS